MEEKTKTQNVKVEQKPVILTFKQFPLEPLKFLCNLSDTATFKVSNKTLQTSIINKSMVAMATFEMPLEDEVKGEFIVNIEQLTKAIHFLGDGFMTWCVRNNRLEVANSSKIFRLSLLDENEMDLPDITQLKWDNPIEIDIGQLKNIIKEVEWFTDYLTFEGKDGKVLVKAKSDIIEYENKISGCLTENFKVSLSLSFLKYLNVFKNREGDLKLKAYFKTDYPAKFEIEKYYPEFKITYILAPRVEEEE